MYVWGDLWKNGIYNLFSLHSDIVVPYIHSYGNKAQKKKWLPGYVTGEIITSRNIFGKLISKHQHNTFKIVEMATEIELGRVFLDRLIEDHMEGRNAVKRVSMAKYWISEMANRVAYNCLQLYGGYGYMDEYPISRDYRDVRVGTIYAGATEVMKSIIAKEMDL